MTPDDERDRQLLAGHLSGGRDAFGELVARSRDRLHAVALGVLSDREEAADALQDALLSAYRSADGYRGDARVSTWLHRIVVDACLDRARRRPARPTVSLLDEDVADGAPQDPYGARDTVLDVRAALAALPVEQRAALVLVDVQGLPVDEAARVLGCSAGTVRTRCARGRARMAAALGLVRLPAPSRARPASGCGPDPGGPA